MRHVVQRLIRGTHLLTCTLLLSRKICPFSRSVRRIGLPRETKTHGLSLSLAMYLCAVWVRRGAETSSTASKLADFSPLKSRNERWNQPPSCTTEHARVLVLCVFVLCVFVDCADRAPRGSLRAVGHAERARAADHVRRCRLRLLRLRRCVSLTVDCPCSDN